MDQCGCGKQTGIKSNGHPFDPHWESMPVRKSLRMNTDEYGDEGFDGDEIIDIRTKDSTQIKTKSPRMYRVILHNDDYTTMDFVVEVLVSVFRKTAAEATRIMQDVHRKGAGVCGVFIRDVAETKVNQVNQLARENQFPLRCSYEAV